MSEICYDLSFTDEETDSERLSDFPKVTRLVFKVVCRPSKAKSRKHSLHLTGRRPFDDSVRWWGHKADCNCFKSG